MQRVFCGALVIDVSGITFSYDKKCETIPGFNLYTYKWQYYPSPENMRSIENRGEHQIYIYGQTRDLLDLLNRWNSYTSNFKYWF